MSSYVDAEGNVRFSYTFTYTTFAVVKLRNMQQR